jgi:hypothetical protein
MLIVPYKLGDEERVTGILGSAVMTGPEEAKDISQA